MRDFIIGFLTGFLMMCVYKLLGLKVVLGIIALIVVFTIIGYSIKKVGI